MKRLLKYGKGYGRQAVLAPLFKMLEASFELFVPLVVAAVIDTGIRQQDIGYILRMSGLLVLLAVIGLTCSITAQYFAAKTAVGFATRLRHALFAHIQSLDFSAQDKVGPATLITRMTSDVNQVQNGINMTLRLLLRSPFVVFGAMVMAFTIDWKAALIFAAAIPLLCLVVFGIMALTMPLYKKTQAELDGVTGITRENLTGVRVIRAFGREDAERSRFAATVEALNGLQQKVGGISGLTNPITTLIINLAIIALLYTGAVRVNLGGLTQGQVVALVNYMSQILVELVKMANLIITITKALACADRVADLLDIAPGMTDAPDAAAAAHDEKGGKVEFNHVHLTYQGAGDESLSDITLTAQPGQTIGVIGGTGSGKSSLVSLLPRFYDPTEGQVLLDGRDLRQWPMEELRAQVGMVPQKALLFSGTIRDNLRWGSENATDEELWQALETAQAADFVREKPGQLDEMLEQGGKNLSGGQRQRLTIARALVRRPRVLVLDDSASALDFATDAALRKALHRLPGAPTVFIVSQRAASLRHADQILVLDEGKAVGLGTHAQLMEHCPVYQEIYESQFKAEDEKGVG